MSQCARPAAPAATPAAAFEPQRRAQARRARLLGGLLLPSDADHGLPLRRAPDVRAAGAQAHGPLPARCMQSLRELLGLVGASESVRVFPRAPQVGTRLACLRA